MIDKKQLKKHVPNGKAEDLNAAPQNMKKYRCTSSNIQILGLVKMDTLVRTTGTPLDSLTTCRKSID